MGYFKIAFLCALLATGVHTIVSYENYWLVHSVNLVFHEAGHVLFMPFGKFMTGLGGTLFEVLLPLFITCYFYLRREYISSCFGLWWLSTALVSASIYISDARERALPLIGGGNTYHDWNYILRELGWLHLDDRLGTFALLLSLAALLFIPFFGWRDTDIKQLFRARTQKTTRV